MIRPAPETTTKRHVAVERTAVSSTVIETEDEHRLKSLTRISPSHLLSMPPNMGAFHIAKAFGFRGYSNTTVTACAAGTQAIGDAAEVIRSGRADVVLCGGSEATLTPLAYYSFAVLRALSTRNGDPAAASRPFDLERDFVNEGRRSCGREPGHAQQRGASRLSGYAATDGATSSPNPILMGNKAIAVPG
jgi:3-oxoacyl-[acyl-carrier-protein] synthase II